jgi:anti-sigma-K factor RskA
LPEPPKGKVYQVWSLILNPLMPTSLGVIEEFSTDKDKVFDLKNTNQSEAFGITLEPAGGSKSPNLEQLCTLGVVASDS